MKVEKAFTSVMRALRRWSHVLRNGSRDLAFGIERIGLLSLRFPVVIACVAAALAVAAGFGIPRIRIDDSISQLFRSDTPQFKQYELESRRFPSSEFDVLVVVEGKSLLERASLDRVRNLVTDLQLIDGTRGVISLFSAREPPTGDQPPTPLVPDRLPHGEDYQKLVSRITSNEIVRGKLLSTDGDLALVVLALDPHAAQGDRLAAIIHDIRTTSASDLAGTELKASLTGVPVMQLEIRHALERDRIVYNATGFAAGCLIAMLFFRRVSFMAVAAGPPLIAILLGLGALGWLGFKLNIFLNVITPLIMVISLSDSMQLTFLAGDRMIAGKSRHEVFRDAITVVGPACVLTHGTAALSFIALQFTQSDLIRDFGKAGLIATAIALVTVLFLVPLFGILLVRDETGFAEDARRADRAVNGLRLACGWIAGRIVSRPALYTLLGLIAVIGFGSVYEQLQPRYRLSDEVPDRGQAVAAAGRLDSELTDPTPSMS